MRKSELRARIDSANVVLRNLIDDLEERRAGLPSNTPTKANDLLDLASSQARAAIGLLNLAERYADQKTLHIGNLMAEASGTSVRRGVALLVAGGLLNPVGADAWDGLKTTVSELIEVVRPGELDPDNDQLLSEQDVSAWIGDALDEALAAGRLQRIPRPWTVSARGRELVVGCGADLAFVQVDPRAFDRLSDSAVTHEARRHLNEHYEGIALDPPFHSD